MFITTQGFKKLIKQAYKTGDLHIANDGLGYTIAGGYWRIWIKHDWIPKKELAAIIELAGELPAEGQAFTVYEEGNQYEIEFPDERSAIEIALECETILEITPLVLRYATGQQARILQRADTGEITLINDQFTDMITNKAIDYEKGEGSVSGPFIHHREYGIFYRSDTMAMRIMPRTDDKNIELLKYLEHFDITGEQEDGLYGDGIPEGGKEKETEET